VVAAQGSIIGLRDGSAGSARWHLAEGHQRKIIPFPSSLSAFANKVIECGRRLRTADQPARAAEDRGQTYGPDDVLEKKTWVVAVTMINTELGRMRNRSLARAFFLAWRAAHATFAKPITVAR